MPFPKPLFPISWSKNAPQAPRLANARCFQAAALAAGALVLCGCFLPGNDVYTRDFPISDGGTATLTFTAGGLKLDENSDVKLKAPAIDLKKEFKGLDYTFGFTEKDAAVPRSVIVEDVSDPKAEILVEDDHPSLQGKSWHGTSGPKLPDDPRLAWLSEPDNTFRIFRFTIVTADGRRLVMYNAAGYQPVAKAYLKKMLAPDKPSNE